MSPVDRHRHTLAGCTPVPLAGYLKALGVLRLVAEQADADARGCWHDEVFHLYTRLSEAGLLSFFLHDYRPSPVVAPWNGGSGFFAGDNRDGFAPLAASEAPRFAALHATIRACEAAVLACGLEERPQGEPKTRFVAHLRSTLPDDALAWIDAALALSGEDLSFPPLLGTGGNDGRLDFTSNFMRRLASDRPPRGLFDAATGAPRDGTAPLLSAALFGTATEGLADAAIGQFAPGAAGGPNATAGFEGPSVLNPWDLVLTIEGALLFAGALTRRNDSTRQGGASFPFTVSPTGAGWGGIAVADEADARAEFWAPLWRRPADAAEIARLLAEGRAVLDGRTVRDGLEFARAAAALGVSRGVDAFQRFGFVMRAGRAYLAAPLGRRPVVSAVAEPVGLIGDLERNDWLRRARRHLRGKDEPARARNAVHRLDNALFALTEPAAAAREVQTALAALGAVIRWLAVAPKAREALAPPPWLSSRWVRLADDGSPEFRVAAALATLGRNHDAGGDAMAPPLAAHLAPLDLPRPAPAGSLAGPAWFDESRRKPGGRDGRLDAVWSDGDLERTLVAILRRRLIDRTGSERGGADPLAAFAGARLGDALAFLGGAPGFDDARCVALLAGLAWARPARLPPDPAPGRKPPPLPLAYAALKPLFTPGERLAGLGRLPEEAAWPIPPALLGRLLSGGTAEAVALAMNRARASGFATPFTTGVSPVGAPGRRLAAALLIPLDDDGLARAVERAFPNPASSAEDTPADRHPETPDAA